MGRWAFMEGTNELFIVESRADGRVSLHIPSSPLVVRRAQAEKIRAYLGTAIADTCPAPAGDTS